MACLGITEAKYSTPMATYEVFLGLSPLHVMNKVEALTGIQAVNHINLEF
jgi:hypothetical protein